MVEKVKKGTWVEIHGIVLTPDERAPKLPDDTSKVPLEMRVKGFLVIDAIISEEVEIMTVTGRRLSGILSEINPAYDHGFGPAIPELVTIGGEVRALIAQEEGVE